MDIIQTFVASMSKKRMHSCNQNIFKLFIQMVQDRFWEPITGVFCRT